MMKLVDSIYGTIKFDKWEEELINTQEMHRLHHIKQLGLAHLRYPAANHSRFEHSVGSGYLARKAIEVIKRKAREFEDIKDITDIINTYKNEVIAAAYLQI